MTLSAAPASPPHPPILEVENLSTAELLLAALAPTDDRWLDQPDDWVFRGQADANWRLLPAALRPDNLRAYDSSASSPVPTAATSVLQITEWELIHKFYVAADQAGLSIPEDTQKLRRLGEPLGLHSKILSSLMRGSPEWPPMDLLSLFALAQHYGVPTRLLDWTWKRRVAAYFACVTTATTMDPRFRVPARFAIWATRANFLSTFWGGEPAGIRLITAPQATNPNLHAQAGLMTVNTDPDDRRPLDEVMADKITNCLATVAAVPRFLPAIRKLTLPAAEAGRLLRLLALDGVSAATVFPGHKGVVTSLEERRSWRR